MPTPPSLRGPVASPCRARRSRRCSTCSASAAGRTSPPTGIRSQDRRRRAGVPAGEGPGGRRQRPQYLAATITTVKKGTRARRCGARRCSSWTSWPTASSARRPMPPCDGPEHRVSPSTASSAHDLAGADQQRLLTVVGPGPGARPWGEPPPGNRLSAGIHGRAGTGYRGAWPAPTPRPPHRPRRLRHVGSGASWRPGGGCSVPGWSASSAPGWPWGPASWSPGSTHGFGRRSRPWPPRSSTGHRGRSSASPSRPSAPTTSSPWSSARSSSPPCSASCSASWPAPPAARRHARLRRVRRRRRAGPRGAAPAPSPPSSRAWPPASPASAHLRLRALHRGPTPPSPPVARPPNPITRGGMGSRRAFLGDRRRGRRRGRPGRRRRAGAASRFSAAASRANVTLPRPPIRCRRPRRRRRRRPRHRPVRHPQRRLLPDRHRADGAAGAGRGLELRITGMVDQELRASLRRPVRTATSSRTTSPSPACRTRSAAT